MNNFSEISSLFLDNVKASLKMFFEPFGKFLNIFSDARLGMSVIVGVFVILLIICIKVYGSFLKDNKNGAYPLAVCAMMIAINVVLELFARDITSYIRVSFSFVTLPIVSMLFGPVAGCIVGILQDFIGFLIKPTGAYIFTLTLNEGIAGMLFGIILYKKNVRIWRILLAELTICMFVNIILNSIALAPTVGSGFVGILPSRIIKNAIMYPIQVVTVYLILKFVRIKLGKR